MASHFYSKIVPDYTDFDNITGTRPPRLVEIVENDGGVGLSIYKDSLGRGEHSSVFFNVAEAEELLSSLRQAIERARPKDAGHENRVKETPVPPSFDLEIIDSNGQHKTVKI